MSRPCSSIVILTGAGISAESGVSTFRDPDGIWARNDWRKVATPRGFADDPDRVHEFYNERRRRLDAVAPNAAHHALAKLERDFSGDFLLVTQNVDDLHERAGSRRMIHMHGQHTKAWCTNCGSRMRWTGDMARATPCPACHSTGYLRPDIVWFGEMPYQMDRIIEAVRRCELFISIGTSGHVYPAAGLVEEARLGGARTLELNLEPSESASRFTEVRYGKATDLVPAFVEQILAN